MTAEEIEKKCTMLERIEKKYTKVKKIDSTWSCFLEIDHQSFCIGDHLRTKKDAKWYANMLAIALERLVKTIDK